MKPRVLIAPAPLKELEPVYGPTLAGAGYEMVFPEQAAQLTELELAAALPGCVACLAGSEPYTRPVIAAAAAKGLKVIARAGVGYDAVDLEAATEHGVAVTFAPGTNQDAVAEHAMLLVLALGKHLIAQNDQVRRGEWPRRPYLPVRRKTLGLIGLGRTGKAVAVRARAFDMTVIAAEPEPDAEFVRRHGITLLPHEEVFRQADWVSLHVPLLPSTRRLVNRDTLALMKPTAFVVNTARGGVVDEADLYDALKNRRIAGAGLDVFEREPPGRHELFALDTVIATAHTAGVDAQSLADMALFPARAIVRLLAGEWPADWVVNPRVKEKFLAR